MWVQLQQLATTKRVQLLSSQMRVMHLQHCMQADFEVFLPPIQKIVKIVIYLISGEHIAAEADANRLSCNHKHLEQATIMSDFRQEYDVKASQPPTSSYALSFAMSSSLQAALVDGGQLILPSHSELYNSRLTSTAGRSQRPSAIFLVQTAREVQGVLKLAARNGIKANAETTRTRQSPMSLLMALRLSELRLLSAAEGTRKIALETPDASC